MNDIEPHRDKYARNRYENGYIYPIDDYMHGTIEGLAYVLSNENKSFTKFDSQKICKLN